MQTIPNLNKETVTKGQTSFAFVVKEKERGGKDTKGEKYIGLTDFQGDKETVEQGLNKAFAFFTREGALKVLQGKADLHAQKVFEKAKNLDDYKTLVVADSLRGETAQKYWTKCKDLDEQLKAGREVTGIKTVVKDGKEVKEDITIPITPERRKVLLAEKKAALAKAVALMAEEEEQSNEEEPSEEKAA